MRNLFLFGTLVISLLLVGCTPSPKNTANDFMKSLVKKDYDKAAAYCGFSKDPVSKELVITVIKEQFEENISSFEITKDSILPNKEEAIAFTDITYSGIRQVDRPIHLKKMGRAWVVDPFVIDE